MKKRRLLFLVLALVLLFTMAFAGCDKKTEEPAATDSKTAEKTDESTGDTTEPEEAGEPVMISWFRQAMTFNVIDKQDEALWFQELEKRTNVDIDLQGPPAGEDYNSAAALMLASGTLTDLFSYNFALYDGGLASAIEDGVVVNVSANEDYKAMVPNWFNTLEEYENVRRAVTLEDGTSALFCHVDLDLRRGAYWGLGIRQDWLDKLDLEKPETMDEMYDVLVAFRDGDPNGNGEKDEIPFTDYNLMGGTWFFGLSDVISPFGILYQENQIDPTTGEVGYWITVNDGENFKQCVTTLNQWYSEGLLDPEFANQEGAAVDANMTGDISGVTHVWPSNFNIYNLALRENNPDASLEGLPALKGPDGVAYSPNSALVRPAASTEGTVVTTEAESDGSIEACLKMINYMYSEEGTDLINWGVEGVSYTVNADGTRSWTEDLTNNADYSVNDMVHKYAQPTFGGWPKFMSYEAWGAIELNTPESVGAHKLWAEADNSLLLPGLVLSAEESSEYARIMNDVKTAIVESFIKFIIGTRPLEEVDDLVQQCKDLGIETALGYYQSAYDRYNSK